MCIIKTIEELQLIQDHKLIYEINIGSVCESRDINEILLCVNLEKIKILVKRNCLKLLLNNLHKYEKLYNILIYNVDSSCGLPIIGSNKSFINEYIFYCRVEDCFMKHYKYVCDKCDTIYKLAETTIKKVIISNNKVNQTLNSLSNIIEELILCVNNDSDIILTNLPFMLKKLLIVTNMNVNNFYDKYIKNIKIPFDCKVTILEEFNKEKHDNEYNKTIYENRLLIINSECL